MLCLFCFIMLHSHSLYFALYIIFGSSFLQYKCLSCTQLKINKLSCSQSLVQRSSLKVYNPFILVSHRSSLLLLFIAIQPCPSLKLPDLTSHFVQLLGSTKAHTLPSCISMFKSFTQFSFSHYSLYSSHPLFIHLTLVLHITYINEWAIIDRSDNVNIQMD